ncbi:MAG: DUF507 family protein [Nitrospira sp.]|nr:DUF507 family protein [Nitrospira sp.]
MLLSDDKLTHLAHVILGCVKKAPSARLIGDDTLALREIKRVLAVEVGQEENVDRAVRTRLASYSKPVVEGSSEWDVMYRKAFEDELRKHRKP